jgi:hypothetical protein
MKRFLSVVAATLFLAGIHTGTASAVTAGWVLPPTQLNDNGYVVYISGSVTLVDTSATFQLTAVCDAVAMQDVDQTGGACYMKDSNNTPYYFAAGDWSSGRTVHVEKSISVPRRTDYRFCMRGGYAPKGGLRVAWMENNREVCVYPSVTI